MCVCVAQMLNKNISMSVPYNCNMSALNKLSCIYSYVCIWVYINIMFQQSRPC